MSKIYRSLKTKFYNSKFYWTQLKRSSIEFAWWGIRSPGAAGEWKKTRKHEVSFYKTLFSQFEVTSVFDIGENVGDKTEIFLSADCTRVQSVDPDPRCFELLNWRFGHLNCVSIANVGVGSSVSVMTFFRFGMDIP